MAPENPRRAEEGRCSWCFAATSHVETRRGRLGGFTAATRAVFRCAACERRTLRCASLGCFDFARGAPGCDEAECYVHRGIIESWADSEGIDALSPTGRCSWCRAVAMHDAVAVPNMSKHAYRAALAGAALGSMLATKNPQMGVSTIQKGISNDKKAGVWRCRCRACMQVTTPCTTEGCDAFARGLVSTLCTRCELGLEDWDQVEARHTDAQIVAPCSWCGEMAPHSRTDAVAEAADGRSPEGGEAGTNEPSGAYECSLCTQPTEPCGTCSPPDGGGPVLCMARRTTDLLKGTLLDFEKTCARCAHEAREEGSWDDVNARRIELDAGMRTQDGLVEVLSRSSDVKTKAFEKGLIRPFLALASLPPKDRAAVAAQLGVVLPHRELYTDPHEEAWLLLSDKSSGLRKRLSTTHENARGAHSHDWLVAVERVTRHIRNEILNDETIELPERVPSAQCLSLCRRTGVSEIYAWERALYEHAGAMMNMRLTQTQRQFVRQLTDAAIDSGLFAALRLSKGAAQIEQPELAAIAMQTAMNFQPWFGDADVDLQARARGLTAAESRRLAEQVLGEWLDGRKHTDSVVGGKRAFDDGSGLATGGAVFSKVAAQTGMLVGASALISVIIPPAMPALVLYTAITGSSETEIATAVAPCVAISIQQLRLQLSGVDIEQHYPVAHVREEVYEYQRWHIFSGWCDSMLPTDGVCPWSTREGVPVTLRPGGELDAAPPGWRWLGEWEVNLEGVDTEGCDEEGWSYSHHFHVLKKLEHPPPSPYATTNAASVVRRRLWTRPRARVQVDQPDLLGTAAAGAAAEPAEPAEPAEGPP